MKRSLKNVRIYDSGDKYIDRYTAVYLFEPEYKPGTYSGRGMSSHPFSPQGFGCSTVVTPGRHLGKRIKFEELPADCQKLILQDIGDENETH